MADTTAANIKAIAPGLSTFIDANPDLMTLILADVALQIDSATYGAKQERAQRYLAAHFVSLANQSGLGTDGGGAIKREKVGDMENEYQKSEFSDASRYDETSYGRTYMSIRRGCIGGYMVVGVG